MESYDIIANQPVVVDNVRLASRGEGGRREGPSLARALSPLPACQPPCSPSLGTSPVGGPAELLPKPSPIRVQRIGEARVPSVWRPMVSIGRAGVTAGRRSRCPSVSDSGGTPDLLG